MSIELRCALLVGLLLYYVILTYFLKKNSLTLQYTLLWLLMGGILILFVLFPGLLEIVRKMLGFQSAMNTLFTCLLGFAFVLIMEVTSIVSKQSYKIKELVQEIALQEKRIRELEKKLEKKDE